MKEMPILSMPDKKEDKYGLGKYENVKDCLVYKITDENDLENIGLKVVGDVSISKLLKHLCLSLPSIMVPSKITIVDKLDKTPSGKLKR